MKSDLTLPKTVDYAVDIVSLSKRFRRMTKKGSYTTLKSLLLNFGARSSAPTYTEAIHDITLRIPRGASVGIIGRNGSGKSTLLKLMSRIYRPDAGTISVNGRVSALIELGAGFHPDFTGRENLFLGGILQGLKREEVEQRFDKIVEFAELEDVIDDPIRTYSSGMYMRLAFSLAIHTDPDVLMIDEVLAVGDASFIQKCKDRISDLRRRGKTLILVSHDLDAVERWCDEVLWLHEGRVKDRGKPRRVIDHYLQFLEKGEENELQEAQSHEPQEFEGVKAAAQAQTERWGSREIEISSVVLRDERGAERLLFHPDDLAQVEITYCVNEPVSDIVFGIGINRVDGVSVFGTNTEIEKINLPPLGSGGIVRVFIPNVSLLEGHYLLDVAAHRADGYPFDYRSQVIKFAVRSSMRQVGVINLKHSWEFEPAAASLKEASND